jgi:hypothetical protein
LKVPPQVTQARRFLAQRGWSPGHFTPASPRRPAHSEALAQTSATAAWQVIGPIGVTSPDFGLVTGRVSALALDPSDPTGNHLYVGTAGGGVWSSQNAELANLNSLKFAPLTDDLAALTRVFGASISIGALTVQPSGTGVILAGTGDPNDALDSWYGVGILRSADDGHSWSLIGETADPIQGLSGHFFSFAGEGFAGFAWSTVNPQLLVAAVSQAYEGTLVDAPLPNSSYEGLYYSSDSGVTWHLARITDGAGLDVQGPGDTFTLQDGNAATSVVWNPFRQLFVAAVRFHGYYQSADGITWTRMAAQPGTGLTTTACPTNPNATGSPDCPVFRGTLAVNPLTGDTFAWTVDANNQDQGIWQDQCSASGGTCANQLIAFARQWPTEALETNDLEGPATIENGDYNLALAAIPSGQDTLLLAGDNDLWKCSLAMGCAWRNTTNADTCMSAQVAGYQHALAWNAANPTEIFLGNDSGLWRSTDAIGETGEVCASTDAAHFQNLNGGLGSLAEVVGMAPNPVQPDTIVAGLGVNGTAGTKSTSQPPADWPQILGGEGGPVAIDPTNTSKWYVNNQAGVSIHLCNQSSACTQSAFGVSPAIDNADVNGDGLTMTAPAPFLVDPMDPTQLLIGTCRVWRGPASGVGWSAGNAISPILDGSLTNTACDGDALIRSIAAAPIPGGEIVYVGMFGSANGGSTLPGHVLTATIASGSSASPTWQDLTGNPVSNDELGMNFYGYDISSIVADPHDASGKTVYVTVEGIPGPDALDLRTVYRTTDGGEHWSNLMDNLPFAPASSLVVDPGDANTVYVATDVGVFSTRQIASCAGATPTCWSAYGTGLPLAPAVQLNATSVGAAAQVLTVGTYGRGIWQIPLFTAGTQVTTATVTPASIAFASQVLGSSSATQTVTLKNTGTASLTPGAIVMTGDFSETDTCQDATVAAGAKCTIQVTFQPTQAGARTGGMTIAANVSGGQLTVSLSGTGVSAGTFSVLPLSVAFGSVQVSVTSGPMQITASNTGGAPVTISSVKTAAPFLIATNQCAGSLAAGASCQVQVEFTPTQSGAASGILTFTDGAGTQTVQLGGTGEAPPTDTLSATSVAFPGTVEGQLSAPVTIILTNAGDLPLTSIGTSVSGVFQASENCGGTLPGHSSCAISTVFAPPKTGYQTGSLTVSDALRAQTVTLSGWGEAPPAIGVSPSKLTFAAQQAGHASAPLTLTVSDTGGAPMANLGFQVTGQSSASFSTGVTTCGANLNSAASCTVQVIFTPAATGGNAASLVVSSSTPGVVPAAVALTGTGLSPAGIAVNPPSMTFNNVVVGTASGPQPVTISNPGGVALNDMVLSISPGFTVSPGTCSGVLAASAKCAASVTFQPVAVGLARGILTVSSASGAATPATVVLDGTGIAPSTIVLSQTELDFGSWTIGQTSTPLKLTISDLGTGALGGLSLTVTGPFQLIQNQCGSSLGATRLCSAEAVFVPTASTTQAGTLTVSSTTAGVASVVVALTGTGMAAAGLQVNPLQLAFGSVLVGSASSALSLAITDTGGATLSGLALSASGDFALSGNNCTASIAPGVSCTTQVIFSPRASGTRIGTLSVTSSSAEVAPVLIPLSGSGLVPGSLTVSPSNLSFGSVTLTMTSAPQTATVVNSGQVAALGLTLGLTGDFSISQTSCGPSLAAGANCTVKVTFSPSAAGNRAGTLTATSTTSGVGPATIALSGAGLPTGYISAVPAQLKFPAEPVNLTASQLTVTLMNPGIAPVAGLQVQTAGDFSATVCSVNLQPGATCRIPVTFTPSALGARTGILTVTSTGAGVNPVVVGLSGTGLAPPSLTLSPASESFSATATGFTSASKTITVSNPGAGPLNTPAVQIAGDFTITASTCTSVLAASGSCTVQVAFAPTAAGARTGTLTVSSSTNGVAPVSASLSGTGNPPATLVLSPTSESFPATATGYTSAYRSIVVTNSGPGSVSEPATAATGDFQVTGNTCGGVLAVKATCTIEVVFTPTAVGGRTGTVTVSTATQWVAAVSASLSGTGATPAAFTVNPAQLTFPVVIAGQSSAAQTVSVTNTGGVSASSMALAASAQFTLTQNLCTGTLASGASCTVGVIFNPSASGPVTGGLSVTSPVVSTPANVALSGTGGVSPSIQPQPGLVTFPLTGVGITSSPLSVTIVNPGTVTSLNNLAFKVTSGAQLFQVAGGTCGSSLGPQSSCTAQVTYNPTATGAQTGTLSITSSTVVASPTVALAGTGYNFTIKDSVVTAQTVSSGQTATFSFSIVPQGNVDLVAFTFQCGPDPPNPYPANAQCILPAGENVSANSTSTVTVQVTTGQAQSSRRGPGPAGWRVLPLACGLLLLPLAWKKRRRALFLVALMAVLTGGVSSCLGSSGGTGGQPPPVLGETPPGNYSIRVTVTSNQVKVPVNLPLTVD